MPLTESHCKYFGDNSCGIEKQASKGNIANFNGSGMQPLVRQMSFSNNNKEFSSDISSISNNLETQYNIMAN